MKISIKKLARRWALVLAIPVLSGVAGFGVITGIALDVEASVEARTAEHVMLPATGPHISPLYALASADPVPAEAPDAAADPAPAPDAIVTSPASWPGNPLDWDWAWILATAVTVLGGIIAALRPIALATRWTGDNWLLAKLEWLLALIVRFFVPASMRGAAGGKS